MGVSLTPILIDVTRLVARQIEGLIASGVDQVSLEYIAYFKNNAYALVRIKNLWVILNKKDSLILFSILISQTNKKKYIKFLILKNYFLNFITLKRKDKYWLFNTGHSGLHLESYRKKLEKDSFKSIFFIHDLIPITHPEYCRQGEAKKHKLRILTALKYHKIIIVNSLDTKRNLENFATKNDFNDVNILVNFLGTKAFQIQKKNLKNTVIKKNYFIILGTIEARKNHNLLLHIWRSLVEQNYEPIPHLIIIGRRGWECETTIDLLERCEKIRPFIIELNYCSDSELVNWLSSAKALLFPSFVEGYGMPLAEAYAVGVPVIASDLAVYREFAGDTPDYLDPLDAIKWREYIIDYTKPDSILRENQLERMQSFKCPTWEKHFHKLENYLSQYYDN